jgi:citrate synthase
MAAPVQEYKEAVDKGLEGVVACTTEISSIQDATLTYRGYTIEDLAEKSTFEEVSYLLLKGVMPNKTEVAEFTKALQKEMVLDAAFKGQLKSLFSVFPKNGHPMDFLRSAVSTLAFFDSDVGSNESEANFRKSLRLIAKMGPIVAAFQRLREGKEILEPKVDQSIAYNFLYLLKGTEPKTEWVKIFDTALVLHADHELNCSAFSTRVTSSSLSDLHSAIVSAIGTLKGPLHGGANTAVMQMLHEIGTIDKAKEFVVAALEGKQKVMGIGHRVYKNGDPRAKILKKISQELTKEVGRPHLYEMSVLIDQTMFDKKGLMPNVDFYSATVYDSMGIPGDIFTPIFAVSRIAGWCAHAMEQYSKNRIYRPRGQYTGKLGLKI